MRYELSEPWKRRLGRVAGVVWLVMVAYTAACTEPVMVEQPAGELLAGIYTSHFEGSAFHPCGEAIGPGMAVEGDMERAKRRIRELGNDPDGSGGSVYVRLYGVVVHTPVPFDPNAFGSRGNGFGNQGKQPQLLVVTRLVEVLDTAEKACGRT